MLRFGYEIKAKSNPCKIVKSIRSDSTSEILYIFVMVKIDKEKLVKYKAETYSDMLLLDFASLLFKSHRIKIELYYLKH